MYKMDWKIKIGKWSLKMIESISINKNVELLSDTATITLPATIFNKALEVETKIKRGDAVEINIGYDNKLVKEFSGYVESISTDGGSLKINCEDDIFQFRNALKSVELKNVTVSAILKHVIEETEKITGKKYSISCDYYFKYDKFVINNATGYDVLKKIQEEAKPNVYMKDNVLHVHPQYIEIFGKAKYDFSKNIDSDGIELKYRTADQRKLIVEVEGRSRDGKVIKVTVGSTGGDKIHEKIGGVWDKKSLMNKANETLKQKVYTGYDGSFKAWLLPYVDAGYQIEIIDSDYEYKNGNYYVLGVETEFSENGGVRKITIGKKLSNG